MSERDDWPTFTDHPDVHRSGHPAWDASYDPSYDGTARREQQQLRSIVESIIQANGQTELTVPIGPHRDTPGAGGQLLAWEHNAAEGTVTVRLRCTAHLGWGSNGCVLAYGHDGPHRAVVANPDEWELLPPADSEDTP